MRLIFHIPLKIDRNDPSAAQIRPQKMLAAFTSLGWEVDVVEGSAKERKRQVSAIRKKIRSGVYYDFCYSESSTMPTLLTEPHHLPTHPFLDFGFLAFCRRKGIPVGLFYRDIHWQYANLGAGLKHSVARYFYKYDLYRYGKILDVLFLPTLRMLEHIPYKFSCRVAELPAGYESRIVGRLAECRKEAGGLLEVLYIGGVGGNYNLLPLLKAVGGMEGVRLTMCCRDYDWDVVKDDYSRYLKENIEVLHESGEALEVLYGKGDLFAMTMSGDYIRFAAPYKLFEAIGHQIPILAAEDTWSGDYVVRHGIGVTSRNEERAIREKIKEMRDNRGQLEEMRRNMTAVAEENRWESRCRQVEKMMKRSRQCEEYVIYKHAWIWLKAESDEMQLSRVECKKMLKRGGWMVRNVYDFDCGEETGFWYVIKDKFGGMEELSSKMRNQVRRSMTNYDFRRMTKEELLESGYAVHRAAALGYKEKAAIPTEEEYLKWLLEGPENDYWGAFDKADGHLAAFAKNIVRERSCNYSVMKALPDEMSRYPYYGLIYSMNQYYLEELGLSYVNDGARSITGHSNIQPFLIQKFNFRKAYCRLAIEYKPWLAVMVKLLYPFRNRIRWTAVRGLLYQESMTR